ncbi:CHC2 zinc finger domain-containing protein [Tsuneonella sp. HG222]
MPYLDFAAIKEDHTIESVADRLGLELKKNGAQLRGPCPSGKGGERALVITPEKGAWYSFGLNKGGDCISLVSLVHGLSPKDAAAWIVGDQQPEKKKPEAAEKERAAEEPSEGFKPLEYLVSDHDAVTALGFDPTFAASVGIGYAPRGVMRGTIAVPVRSSKGKLLGYIGVTDAKLPSNWHL